jgi:hypothetical protein
MSYRDEPGVPHSGWRNLYVHDCDDDPRESGDPEPSCDMCGRVPVRYWHCMVHESYSEPLLVCSYCAAAMCEGYDAKAAEDSLEKRSAGRI